ncbi:Cysteine desulfurase [Thermosinus carboxydivorans Nor1]|uniref:Cysteine desulfurase n=1 Tax=Thermosinus carboxydivorans Nor1 TaxID=401526 RepID=A1HNU9_9FIRM|nr:aminotransferase class V-fold PLP-dependent enzyme [Thermosinus carboxydivorans]EAX48451.1 Cysteine desulfurase [Thermosinus carboxydivorans Nor1]
MRCPNIGLYLRNVVAGVDVKVPLADGQYVTAINFDNAATTPPFRAVMTEIMNYAPWYGSVHRGKGYKSVLTSKLYEAAREVVRRFVNASGHDVVIFTKNTTESINILAHVLAAAGCDQVVLSTQMEHLANDLPWRERFTTDYVAIDEYGRLSLPDLEAKLLKYQGRVKLVAVTGASNVTGYINPIYEIARLAHKYGAKIFVDGAQLVSHVPVDMKPVNSLEHIDYLAFSGHKMYAPFGAGALIGPRDAFENAAPVYKGGGAVGLVSSQSVQWDEPPARFEAGTPNMMGVLALATAIKTLLSLDMKAIAGYERKLIEYAIEGLATVPGLTLYSRRDKSEDRVSLISFTLEGLHHSVVADILAQEAGIASRSGLFCAHPYVEKLLNLSDEAVAYYQTHDDVLVPGLVRVSFGLYNDCREVDVLIDCLQRIAKKRDYYKTKYQQDGRGKRCAAACLNRYLYC